MKLDNYKKVGPRLSVMEWTLSVIYISTAELPQPHNSDHLYLLEILL